MKFKKKKKYSIFFIKLWLFFFPLLIKIISNSFFIYSQSFCRSKKTKKWKSIKYNNKKKKGKICIKE